MKKEYLFLAIGFLGGVIIAVLLSINIIGNNNSGFLGTFGMMGNQARFQNEDFLDAHFIEQMIPHHEDTITMAELALEKSTRPEVRELAQNIIESQGKEIDQMKQWYKSWFNRELPTGDEVMMHHGMGSGSRLHMGIMGDNADFENLEDAEDFDREFVEEMIPHHQMAVMMASMLKNGTQREEMKKLADDIIKAQTKEIDQMREWLRTW